MIFKSGIIAEFDSIPELRDNVATCLFDGWLRCMSELVWVVLAYAIEQFMR